MNLESEPGTKVKLIINNHKKNSDKLTKISGRDLTTKFTKYKKKSDCQLSYICMYIKILMIVQY